MPGALNQYKIDFLNLVKTGFQDKYNELVDKVIYDVIPEPYNYGTSGGTILRFLTNVGEIDVNVSSGVSSLANLSDVVITNAQSGDTIIYNGTSWVNVNISNFAYNENNIYQSTTFITNTATYNSSISTLDEILTLLAPAKPTNLSQKILTLNPAPYTAIQTRNGIVRNTITNNQSPEVLFNPYTNSPPSTNNGAYNGNAGDLTGKIITKKYTNPATYITAPAITFTPASEAGLSANDPGNNIRLLVTDDFDYHFGVAGKAGFWKAFLSKVQNLTALTYYPDETHEVSMTHTNTGTTTLEFYIDDPVTPTVNAIALSTAATGITRISGVPTLVTNDVVRSQFNVNNAIKTFYPASISRTDSLWTTTSQSTDSGIKIYNQVYNADLNVSVLINKYTEDLIMTCRGYNSIAATGSATGTISTTQTGRTMRLDTISNESARVKSGAGTYPTTGYGATYDSNELLGVNQEIQMLAGEYRYPDLNYTTNYPVAGPNYTSFTGWRWVTFKLNVSAIQNVRVVFNGSNLSSILNGDGATLNSAKFALQVRVDGSISSGGWIDGNRAYPGSGNPNNDGDFALAVAASNATTKVVTFGTAVKTGVCYVRIGLHDTAKGAGYLKFTGVTITAS